MLRLFLSGVLVGALTAVLPLDEAVAKPERHRATPTHRVADRTAEQPRKAPRGVRRAASAHHVASRSRLPPRKTACFARRATACSVAPAVALPLIMIDAGHGGGDPGAIGPAGTTEKTVALAAARELGRQILATHHYRVLFTRTGDRFVSLPARLHIAARNGAALMISLHADSSPDRHVRGASVYVRSAQSTGPEVAHLPARGAARAIARALSRTVPSDSVRLQLALVASLDDDLSMVLAPTREAHLYVLGTTGIPSVLVEMGFISNPKDEGLLRTSRHRAVIASAIRDAVNAYFAGEGRQPRT